MTFDDLLSDNIGIIKSFLSPLECVFVSVVNKWLYSLVTFKTKKKKRTPLKRLLLRYGNYDLIRHFRLPGWNTDQLDTVVRQCGKTDNADTLRAMYETIYTDLEKIEWCRVQQQGRAAQRFLLRAASYHCWLYDCVAIFQWLIEGTLLDQEERHTLIESVNNRIRAFPDMIPKIRNYYHNK